jgi:signal transduction histidine kinase
MRQFMVVTTQNDHLAAEMRARVAWLITLTDRARQRQRASNADIVASLTQKERQLRAAREIVQRAQDLRAHIASVALQELQRNYATTWDAISAADRQLTVSLMQLRRAAAEIAPLLQTEGRTTDAGELTTVLTQYEQAVAGQGNADEPNGGEGLRRARTGQQLADWAERLLKIRTTEERALQEEVGQLVTYSVQANETEQATQNIAIETLKLGQRTADALASRDVDGAAAILGDSQELAGTVGALPISPLIQSEIVDAVDQWRKRLITAIAGLRSQNDMIAAMDKTAGGMVEQARKLNDAFAAEGNRIGEFIRTMLLVGATIGLWLGSVAAFFVARSITRPLVSLQKGMLALANNPLAGPIPSTQRRDELGDMARAVNFFVTEISRREQALRRAKEKADSALEELRRTQAELIQAEKLASLGQLVAGVAHEINTPVGIALTTATTLSEEVQNFGDMANSGQVSRTRFTHFVDRMREGSQLLFSNLTRAAELVHSFKQVAADQVSSERRSFRVSAWAHELLTSLRPVLRKSGHEVSIECPDDLSLDTYPGALAQVITNLIMNAVVHAFPPGVSGRLTLRVNRLPSGNVRIVFADNGRGIPAEDLGRVFDPFFTTARSGGNTGLGLHIVYNLVTSRLQGRIEVESEAGEGTRFTITLPASVAEATPERARAIA